MSEHFEIMLLEDITDTTIFGLLTTGPTFFVTFTLHFSQPIPKCSVQHQLFVLSLVGFIVFRGGSALKFIHLFLNSSHNREVRWSYLNNHGYIFPMQIKRS